MRETTMMPKQNWEWEKTHTPKNILIIDDNTSLTSLFSRYLSMKGLSCTVSNDGQNGLKLIQTGKFDVILLDLSMPEFSGFDIINSIEASGEINGKKIFVLTASSITNQEVDELQKRGIIGCIKKPVTVNQLLAYLGIPKD